MNFKYWMATVAVAGSLMLGASANAAIIDGQPLACSGCDQATATGTAGFDGSPAEFTFTDPVDGGFLSFFFGDAGTDLGGLLFTYTNPQTPSFTRTFMFTIPALVGHTVDTQSQALETVSTAGGILTIAFNNALLKQEGNSSGSYVLTLSDTAGAPPTRTPEPSTLLLGALGLIGLGLARRK